MWVPKDRKFGVDQVRNRVFTAELQQGDRGTNNFGKPEPVELPPLQEVSNFKKFLAVFYPFLYLALHLWARKHLQSL